MEHEMTWHDDEWHDSQIAISVFFMKSSRSWWGAWMMRWLFERGASAENAHTQHRGLHITCAVLTHNAILLLILSSGVITSKCCSGCFQLHVKRLCSECYLFPVCHSAFHVFNGSDSRQWEITAVLPRQIPADGHIQDNICIHPPLALLAHSQEAS